MRSGSCRASGATNSWPAEIVRESIATPAERFAGFEQITPGMLDERQYDSAIGDLVAYLQWMGEPAQGTRVRIGVGVLIFLGLLVLITWRLSSAYWRTVH